MVPSQDMVRALPARPVDMETLELAYCALRKDAVRHATRILRDPQLAEDAVQSAFVRLLQRVCDGDSHLLSADAARPVMRNTRWVALNMLTRDVDRGRELVELSPALPAEGRDQDVARLVAERLMCSSLLSRLPGRYREVLHRRYMEQQADAEAAASMGITLKAYRRSADRALQVARRSMGEAA